MNRQRMSIGYDSLSAVYDLMARMVYGNALRRSQTCFLNHLPSGAEVLVLGGGSGWFLEKLLVTAQPRYVMYVELSAKMLERTRARIKKNCPQMLSRVDFVLGSADRVEDELAYDAVMAHCLLDMFDGLQLQTIVSRMRRSLRPGGFVYFSDFRYATAWPMTWISRMLIWSMYRFFRWWCAIPARRLPNFKQVFDGVGLHLNAQRHFYGGMIQAQIWKRMK
ncbi:MAG: class I SAM-dependent methyltransferase [Bacteroidia bacterium]